MMRADRLLAFAMFLLCGALLYATPRLEDLELVDPLGHRAFPYIVAVGAFLSGALLLLENYFTRRNASAVEVPSNETESHPVAALGVLGWMLLWYLLLDHVGFVISIAAFLFGLTSFFNRGKVAVNAIVSVCFSVSFYFLFTELIGAPLARGFLGF
ncbi:MAG: tripartite tricarboxylate transporter TctB family protein [Rhodospirillaceae bacterium]|jgi:putative tricarboxylic transport membrane protein|nr:tripartite tricarboxylate transporter TctB family protein [Rhodospirillales bacterium]MBT3906251.1 tripartite tricarboxylate transporter TctB family protein [Rhodospirillaceae bacterium]MBT5033668.1 tripartite tricarboxylate transporter TctB family protein [Rhodospirillaceae bacterium]MBT6219479.1 tripartite tricarboxylate transporter TctB family protein [Rhodospirillaceae bacterium]MBT6364000.1 tripartite tricarboxylate transporter TctB family protein [Rhodospirillaceae bacterium]